MLTLALVRGSPESIAGMGVLNGSLTVHADGEPERLPAWLCSVRDGTLPGGRALDDGVGLLFRGTTLERALSSRPGAGLERVDAVGGELVRRRLNVELLRARRGPLGPLRREDAAVRELRCVHQLRSGIYNDRDD